jgi:nicotinamide-nucleotide amidase
VLGDQRDANSSWLARALARHGWLVEEARLVGDDEQHIAAAVGELARRVGLVLVTGGLGPTLDDVTRHGVARAAGASLRRDPAAFEEVAAWYRARQRPMPASNERQALIPDGAELLRNAAGTAPGFRLRVGPAWVAVLPGPPHEMRTVFERELAPWLAQQPAAGEVRLRAQLRLFGLSESEFADRVGAWMERDANPRVGVLARTGMLVVKLVSAAPDEARARELLDARLADLRGAFGAWLFAEGEQELAEVVARRSILTGTTLATAESCTGGLVAELLTREPGISATFLEGFVTYTNRAKQERLGVPAELIERHGAVSLEVAAAMARGAAERSGAQVAVSVTGVAGPGGGTPEKPVGLVCFGLARDGEVEATERRFPPRSRKLVREWAAHTALDLLRRALPGPGGTER